jgi:hypothetical protein
MDLKKRLAQPDILRAFLPLFPGAHALFTIDRVLHHNAGRIARSPTGAREVRGWCYAAPVLISKASL